MFRSGGACPCPINRLLLLTLQKLHKQLSCPDEAEGPRPIRNESPFRLADGIWIDLAFKMFTHRELSGCVCSAQMSTTETGFSI